jgi:3-hydroxyisobutyrate dehydrogenase
MSKPSVGWVGLGNMGTRIAKNLLKAGYSVTVNNRTKSKEKELLEAGASSAPSPQSLWQQCDIVFTMVSDDAAVKEIFEGKHGLLSSSPSGKLAIDMSTVSPATSRYLAGQCHKKGVQFLDAPVSGSVKPAQEGTLLIMVGGAESAYQRAKPLFDVIGKLSLHVGNNGAGTSAKLAINYFLGLTIQGLAETVLFARQNGIDTKGMLKIINEGALESDITRGKSTNILQHDFKAAFALKHLAKDLRLAEQAGLNMPLSSPLLQSFQNALSEGLGEEDVMAIFKYLDKQGA